MKEIAYFYNRGMKNGKADVVFNRKGMVWDVERGLLDDIQPGAGQISSE